MRLLLFILSLLTPSALTADNAEPELVQVDVERLPDMNIPRSGHFTYCINGEVTVFGGHTTGFVPTATAEYYSDGAWHLVPMTYTHDQGLSLQLSTGKVLLAGGHEQPLGIGQIYSAEFYDPATHSFEGFGCMDRKRCFADAVELDSGRVVIAGNWYHSDGVEFFDGHKRFTSPQTLPSNARRSPSLPSLTGPGVGLGLHERSCPFVLRTSANDAMIFSRLDTHGNRRDTIIVDRLNGDTLDVPLFRTWRPTASIPSALRSADAFIGDTARGIYAYILPVECNKLPTTSDSLLPRSAQSDASYLKNRGGVGGGASSQIAIALVRGTDVTLLPTDAPLPQVSPWDSLRYVSSFIADRRTGRAYLLGFGTERLYVLRVDYGDVTSVAPAHLTLYYTPPLDSPPTHVVPALTPEGDIILTGGFAEDNFKPLATTLVLHVATPLASASVKASQWPLPLTLAFAVLIVVAVVALLFTLRHRYKVGNIRHVIDEETDTTASASPTDAAKSRELLQRITTLMQQERLYLAPELKVSDVAARLQLPPRRISECLSQNGAGTFATFINTFRIRHAMNILRQQPDKKLTQLGSESGFASESTFFRAFKANTGLTPSEWLQKNS